MQSSHIAFWVTEEVHWGLHMQLYVSHFLQWQNYNTEFHTISTVLHDDVIKWKHFPRYWPFVRGIHRSPVYSPHKGQWRGALMFTLICARINAWENNREAGDLRRYRTYSDVIVMVHNGPTKPVHSAYYSICTHRPCICTSFCKTGCHVNNILSAISVLIDKQFCMLWMVIQQKREKSKEFYLWYHGYLQFRSREARCIGKKRFIRKQCNYFGTGK